MANVLGTLLVELGVNIAAYLDGMDKASYKAKATGKQIQDSFNQLGNALGGVLSQFGAVGGIIESALGNMGNFAGTAVKNLGGLGGAMGVVGAGAGLMAGAMVAAAAGGVALAEHAATSAAELYHMSEATGVSVETLSRLGYAGRQVGVDQDTMTRSLERMSKSAFTAATAAQGTQTIYSRLGITVKDTATGALRPMEDILGDVANAFQNNIAPSERAGVAMQLFGRGGAALIPLLVGGRDAVKGFAAEADAFGVTVSTATAQASVQFEQGMQKMKEAGTGLANQLLVGLLPAMNSVVTAIDDGLKSANADGTFKAITTAVQFSVGSILSFGDLIFTLFRQIGAFLGDLIGELVVTGETAYRIADRAAHLDWKGVATAAKDGFNQAKGVLGQFINDSEGMWKGYAKFSTSLFSAPAQAAAAPKTEPKGGIDLTPKGSDKRLEALQAEINKLKEAATVELAAADAVGQNSAAILINKAAAEGAAKVQELLGKAVDQSGQPIKAEQALIKKNADAIKQWYEIKAAAASLAGFGTKVADETGKLVEQTSAMSQLTAAYLKGGAAIEDAKVSQALAADNAELTKQNDIYGLLVNDLGATNPMVVQFKADLDKATGSVKAHGDAIRAADIAKLGDQIALASFQLRAEAAAFDIVSAAALKSASAQREAAAQAAAAKFAAENPEATVSQINAIADAERQRQDIAYRGAVNATAAQYNLNKTYDDEMTKLKAAREVLTKNGADTLLIDAQIYDAQQKINASWDAAAIQVGTFGQKVRGALDTIKRDGDNLGAHIFDTAITAVGDLNTELSKLVSGQKTNFAQLGQSIQASLAKAAFQKIESSLAGGILNKLGLGGILPGTAPDGSSSNPYTVKLASDSLSALASGGGLGNILGGGKGGAGKGLISGIEGIAKGVGGVFGKIGGFFSSIFGGFLAGGGDVTPGRAYIVGEKRPELFMPGTSGRIVPNVNAGKSQQTQVTMHIHGVTDADSFRKSQAQITSQMGSAVQRAQQRTR